jgi:hypothetical protein
MPRSRSTAIQSERTRRRSPRAFTSPATWIAPPNSSNFSVNVVLPGNRLANCYYADLSPNQPADKAADQDANQNKSKCMLLWPCDAVFFQDMR